MNRRLLSTLAVGCVFCLMSTGVAEHQLLGKFSTNSPSKPTGDATVENQIHNDTPAFLVRIDVDHQDHVYRSRDLLKMNVVSEKDGYLYVLYHMADGQITCLFPNRCQTDNRIEAFQKTMVPAANANYNIRIGAPYGQETLIAVVAQKPLTHEALGVTTLTDKNFTPLDKPTILKGVEAELKPHAAQWAEHRVQITTYKPGQVANPDSIRRKRRLGLFIGIDEYLSKRYPALNVCHEDATQMAKLMMKHGNVEAAIVLTNSDATLAQIRLAFTSIVNESAADDEVFIYWSGHGGQIRDDNGDESDGDNLDEFLVPHDVQTSSFAKIRGSVLMDDTFGRWVQELDGRKVVIMIDSCHAGGQLQGPAPAALRGFDFGISETVRYKDVGQSDATMLLSSQASETSKVRLDGTLSVMTHYLIELLKVPKALTLESAFKYIQPRVRTYVESNFPTKDPQTPVLSHTSGPIYLRY